MKLLFYLIISKQHFIEIKVLEIANMTSSKGLVVEECVMLKS